MLKLNRSLSPCKNGWLQKPPVELSLAGLPPTPTVSGKRMRRKASSVGQAASRLNDDRCGGARWPETSGSDARSP